MYDEVLCDKKQEISQVEKHYGRRGGKNGDKTESKDRGYIHQGLTKGVGAATIQRTKIEAIQRQGVTLGLQNATMQSKD